MRAPGSVVTTEDVERTGRVVSFALWGIASIVMVGSMVSGGYAFHDLGEPAVFGVLTAFAADVALTSWLVISSRLRALGITLVMGVVLELTCGAVSVFLNVGAAVFQGLSAAAARTMLAIAHSFLPILLVLVSLAGSEAHLRLVRLRGEREAADQAQRAGEHQQREDRERRRTEGELTDAQAVFAKARELRLAAKQETQALEAERQEAARVRAEIEAEARATQVALNKLTELRPPPVAHRPRRNSSSTKRLVPVEDRRRWVRDRLIAGIPTRGRDVDEEFGTNRSGHRIVADVEKELAEEKRRALHALTGGRQ